MQTIYAVLWIDRHVDETIHLFTDRDEAIAWAKQRAYDNNNGYDPENEGDVVDLNDTDYIAYFPYNCEGDHLRVMKLEVDSELED